MKRKKNKAQTTDMDWVEALAAQWEKRSFQWENAPDFDDDDEDHLGTYVGALLREMAKDLRKAARL